MCVVLPALTLLALANTNCVDVLELVNTAVEAGDAATRKNADVWLVLA